MHLATAKIMVYWTLISQNTLLDALVIFLPSTNTGRTLLNLLLNLLLTKPPLRINLLKNMASRDCKVAPKTIYLGMRSVARYNKTPKQIFIWCLLWIKTAM